MKNRIYYEALSMAEYALEGNTRLETAKEFRVSARTVGRRMEYLAKEKPELYKKVIESWHKNDNYESKII